MRDAVVDPRPERDAVVDPRLERDAVVEVDARLFPVLMEGPAGRILFNIHTDFVIINVL